MARSVILLSASPRRYELLTLAGYTVDVRPSHVDESWPGGSPEEGVMALAVRKRDAMGDLKELSVAADSLVVLGDRILGKPCDAEEAVAMLRSLSGKTHRVITAFCVSHHDKRIVRCVSTDVSFRTLSETEIVSYVATGEPFDKAGAYGIQSKGGLMLVDQVRGSYTNVIGLPLQEVLVAMEELA